MIFLANLLIQSIGITVKRRKSRFLRRQVNFIGHVISANGVGMHPKRWSAIQEYPKSGNFSELRAFLCFLQCDQRFCKNYSHLTLQQIKDGHLLAVTVRHPDFGKIFFIQTSSSDCGIGGCLFPQRTGVVRP